VERDLGWLGESILGWRSQSLCVEANSSDLVRFRVGDGHGVSIYLDVPRAFRTKKEKKGVDRPDK